MNIYKRNKWLLLALFVGPVQGSHLYLPGAGNEQNPEQFFFEIKEESKELLLSKKDEKEDEFFSVTCPSGDEKKPLNQNGEISEKKLIVSKDIQDKSVEKPTKSSEEKKPKNSDQAGLVDKQRDGEIVEKSQENTSIDIKRYEKWNNNNGQWIITLRNEYMKLKLTDGVSAEEISGRMKQRLITFFKQRKFTFADEFTFPLPPKSNQEKYGCTPLGVLCLYAETMGDCFEDIVKIFIACGAQPGGVSNAKNILSPLECLFFGSVKKDLQEDDSVRKAEEEQLKKNIKILLNAGAAQYLTDVAQLMFYLLSAGKYICLRYFLPAFTGVLQESSFARDWETINENKELVFGQYAYRPISRMVDEKSPQNIIAELGYVAFYDRIIEIVPIKESELRSLLKDKGMNGLYKHLITRLQKWQEGGELPTISETVCFVNKDTCSCFNDYLRMFLGNEDQKKRLQFYKNLKDKYKEWKNCFAAQAFSISPGSLKFYNYAPLKILCEK